MSRFPPAPISSRDAGDAKREIKRLDGGVYADLADSAVTEQAWR